MARIRSESAQLQLLEALRHNRRKRTQRGEFLIEGVQAINRAIEHDWPIRAVLVPEGIELSSWARSVSAACPDAQHHTVRADLFARLADRDDPPELVLVGAIAEPTLADLHPPDDGIVVVVDRPSRPGNLGTILRTSDALGAAAVVTVGHGAHLYDPRTVRASVGSLFALPALNVPGPADVAAWLEQWRHHVHVTAYATDEDGEVDLADLDAVDDVADDDDLDGTPTARRPALLMLGTERSGLSRGLRDLADVTVRIPMAGSASSLNVAVAHAIVLHALTRPSPLGRDEVPGN
jgi:tRNA G18 (ribose-2'-O)-methylase SpoU